MEGFTTLRSPTTLRVGLKYLEICPVYLFTQSFPCINKDLKEGY